MNGQSIAVDSTDMLWYDNRLDLNKEGQVLITTGIINFLDFLKRNFSGHKAQWDGLLVNGMSGSGKSVSFALGAAFLDSMDKYDVYWFRTPETYLANSAALVGRRVHRDRERVRVVFVDQADKLGDQLDIFIGSGSETMGLFTIGCASGNARVKPSSSRATRIKEYLYDPSIDYKVFRTFFDLPDDHTEYHLPRFKSTREMLDYQVNDFPTLYVGTSGHFLSMAKFRKENKSNGNFKSHWDILVKSLSKDMETLFTEENPSSKDPNLFYARLHKIIFLNSDLLAGFDETYNPDKRFIYKGQLFSPLFAQSYRAMLLLRPPSKILCKSLSDLKASENPTIRGFCIERYVLEDMERVGTIAREILARDDIRFVDSSVTHINCGVYGYGGELAIPEDMARLDKGLRMWSLIPLQWNAEDVDAVLIFTRGKAAVVIGIQITLAPAAKHSSSLRWFRSNEFETQLTRRCKYEVLNILLFICNPYASDLKTSIRESENKHVFEFPLSGILPDGLSRQIVKSDAIRVCRKLNVKVETGAALDSHSDINNATMPQLRSFCQAYSKQKFKKKAQGLELAYEIHRKYNPSCVDCNTGSGELKRPMLMRLH